MKISAIIITRNEEARIAKCLSSLAWADEIIVVDSGSTDTTREIAKVNGATVISAGDIHDFARLRTIGKEKAHGEWLLYIDADEVVTPQLSKEIQNVTRPPDSYAMYRKNFYLGQPWPFEEKILRLFHAPALKEWYGELHESPRVQGEVGTLRAPLLHDTHRTLAEMVAKTNEWSEAEAKLRFDAGHPPIVWWRLIRVMLTAFFDSFIWKSGWRAGAVGWIESIYQAFSIFITYAKLWELQQSNKVTK